MCMGHQGPSNQVHGVRKLDLLQLCFSLNCSFSYVPPQFPSMFLLLTYSQPFFSLSADYPRHSRQRRSKIPIQLLQEQSKYNFTTQESLKIPKPTIGSNGRPVSVPTLELCIHYLHIPFHLNHGTILHSVDLQSSQKGISLDLR